MGDENWGWLDLVVTGQVLGGLQALLITESGRVNVISTRNGIEMWCGRAQVEARVVRNLGLFRGGVVACSRQQAFVCMDLYSYSCGCLVTGGMDDGKELRSPDFYSSTPDIGIILCI